MKHEHIGPADTLQTFDTRSSSTLTRRAALLRKTGMRGSWASASTCQQPTSTARETSGPRPTGILARRRPPSSGKRPAATPSSSWARSGQSSTASSPPRRRPAPAPSESVLLPLGEGGGASSSRRGSSTRTQAGAGEGLLETLVPRRRRAGRPCDSPFGAVPGARRSTRTIFRGRRRRGRRTTRLRRGFWLGSWCWTKRGRSAAVVS